jgi:diguanylate cyclase (GGDEF)-like protein
VFFTAAAHPTAKTGTSDGRIRASERPALAGFGAEAASPRRRLAFLAIGLVFVAGFLIIVGEANRALLPLPAFLPAFLATVVVSDLITAYLLFIHAPLSCRFDLLAVACAYLFTSLIALAQLLVFPGVITATGLFGAGPQSAVWLWVFWHAGFPALITVAMLLRAAAGRNGLWRGPNRRHGMIAAASVLLLVVLIEILVTQAEALLPTLIRNGNYLSLSEAAPGQIVFGLNCLAFLLVLAVTRGRSMTDLCLILAVLAAAIDASLTLRAGARFSLGWYAARLCSVASCVPVLAVYLREITFLYARVIRLNEQLHEQASVDGITGLFNRRHFNRALAEALASAASQGRPLGLLLIDVDHFKRYNDSMGHFAGDEALQAVARAIGSTLDGHGELAARYGGEEFAMVLPDIDKTGAEARAATVRRAIQAEALHHPDSPTGTEVTVSVGIGLAAPGASFADLIRAADASLYAAKHAGRDRCGPPLPDNDRHPEIARD